MRPDGDAAAWTISLGPSSPVTIRYPPGAALDGDEVITGSAVGLYMAALWNRGEELGGDPATLAWWRTVARIRWS